MNENDFMEDEISKAKNIRRILLLKTDQELKSNSKRYSDIMINSKTIKELNQAYNSYKILLSESSSTYSNYVQLSEQLFPEFSEKDSEENDKPQKNRVEEIIKSLNSSFESHSPPIDFIPNKIDLGKKKFSFIKKGSIKNPNSPKFFDEIKESNNKVVQDEKIKSTKLENKNIHKVIDKIVCLKLPNDVEDDDVITKNVIKLRKYCYRLIKKRKKNKRSLKSKPPISFKKHRPRGEKTILKKRKTTVTYNTYGKKSIFVIKDNTHQPILSREDTYEKHKVNLNVKINERDHSGKSRNNKSHERKDNKMNSLKDLQTIREKTNDKTNFDKKRKLRRVQTLNLRNQPQLLSKLNQKKEAKKNNDTVIKQVNQILKEPIISTKFARPSKFVIINNNINNANIIVKKDVKKKNSLFGMKKDFKRQKTIIRDKEKDKNNIRSSLKKNPKHTVKLFSPEFRAYKIPSDI